MKKRVLFAIAWYDVNFHKGVAAYALEHDWEFNVAYHESPYGYANWQGDGVVCMLDPNPMDPMTAFVKALRVPKVELTAEAVCDESLLLAEDNGLIGRLAADYLRSKGFTSFYYFTSGLTWQSEERFNSFQMVLEQQGFSAQLINFPVITEEAKVKRQLGEVIEQMSRPAAVFCSFDKYARLMVDAAKMSEVRIPEELAVLGTGDIPMLCEFSKPTISSVASDQFGWGYEAARLLDEQMAGQSFGERLFRFPPKGITERQSTDYLALQDPYVVDALRFIGKHFSENIGVEEVAKAVGLSRTALNHHLKKQLGHGVNEQIIRQRLEEAKRLLRESNLTGAEVAEKCGFSSAYYFYRIFKGKCGQTTKTYRQTFRR